MAISKIILLVFFLCALSGCENDDNTASLTLTHIFVGTEEINLEGSLSTGLPIDRSIALIFTAPVSEEAAENAIMLKTESGSIVDTDISLLSQSNSVVLFPAGLLARNSIYTIDISGQLKGANGESFVARQISFKTAMEDLQVTAIEIGGVNTGASDRITEVPLDLSLTIHFSVPVDVQLFDAAADFSGDGLQSSFFNDNKSVVLTTTTQLKHLWKYTFSLSNSLKGAQGENFQGIAKTLYTTASDTPQFPVIPDEELLTKVQQQTFKYFWDFAHPASGMARERNTSGNIVTSGGSGFGIMAIIVGIERNFITRAEGVARMDKIVTFLEGADRFHGAWSHWIDGNTGDVIPFSTKDNGGDLVETSFLVQGLLTFRQYLQPSDTAGNNLIDRITDLWETVEWDWYRKNNENVLYWHWSPNYSWEMNFAMYGYFEEQITYFLAAASPTHSIPKIVYTNGYAKNGAIVKNNMYYGYKLPLESPSPLFWVHYSYLGLDPRFSDGYANYWEQNVNATLINQTYCITNPKNYVGYSENCWGLTSSDNQNGYDAHSPLNDKGVITPTAALSSFPYTPEESMKALKFFYYKLGDRLWGEYGFYDAFNLTEAWTANSYLAIDQGPIIVMIENYRTGLLWDLFMSAPEVQNGVTTLGFTY